MILQMLATLSLVIGITIGEFLASKVFGVFKKMYMQILEVVLFVVLLVFILNSFVPYNSWFSLLIYFVIGFITVVFVKGVLSGAGILSYHLSKKMIKKRDSTDLLIGLKKALERRGFKQEDIKRIAKECGFKDVEIKKVFELK
ncbi:MAG: hypothetical protein J7K22_04205 [Nanoarchaeota archaeon]|nr:hypothetical protein [Nanoarchaeota archaeon]